MRKFSFIVLFIILHYVYTQGPLQYVLDPLANRSQSNPFCNSYCNQNPQNKSQGLCIYTNTLQTIIEGIRYQNYEPGKIFN
jgi:hypothetical protein